MSTKAFIKVGFQATWYFAPNVPGAQELLLKTIKADLANHKEFVVEARTCDADFGDISDWVWDELAQPCPNLSDTHDNTCDICDGDDRYFPGWDAPPLTHKGPMHDVSPLVTYRALILWDHNVNGADKMKALFPDRHMPPEQDSWYQEKLGIVNRLPLTTWVGSFDYPTQERIVRLALKGYGAAAREWIRVNREAPWL